MASRELVHHGVDFSGAEDVRRKLWVSALRDGERATARAGYSHAELVEAIARAADDGRRHVFLVDAPFGLPLEDLAAHGVEPTWRATLEWLAGFESPRDWRRAYRDVSRKERRRAADRRMRTPLAPANLRLFKQTWHALVSVLRPLLACDGVAVLPMVLAGAEPERAVEVLERCAVWIAEGCPSSTLEHMGWPRQGYKGPSPQNRSCRADILARLEREAAVAVEPATERMALDDSEGDALDSLVLLAAARRFAAADHAAVLRDEPAAAVEGWVYV